MANGAEYHVIEIVPGAPVLRVAGEIDDDAIAGFREAVAAVELRAKFGMVVVLDDARLGSAAPYSTLIAAGARLGIGANGPLLVVCPDDHLASRVLRTLHLEPRRVETLIAAMALLRCSDGSSVAVNYAEGFLRAAVT